MILVSIRWVTHWDSNWTIRKTELEAERIKEVNLFFCSYQISFCTFDFICGGGGGGGDGAVVSAWLLWCSTCTFALHKRTEWLRGSDASSSTSCRDFWPCDGLSADSTSTRNFIVSFCRYFSFFLCSLYSVHSHTHITLRILHWESAAADCSMYSHKNMAPFPFLSFSYFMAFAPASIHPSIANALLCSALLGSALLGCSVGDLVAMLWCAHVMALSYEILAARAASAPANTCDDHRLVPPLPSSTVSAPQGQSGLSFFMHLPFGCVASWSIISLL